MEHAQYFVVQIVDVKVDHFVFRNSRIAIGVREHHGTKLVRRIDHVRHERDTLVKVRAREVWHTYEFGHIHLRLLHDKSQAVPLIDRPSLEPTPQ